MSYTPKIEPDFKPEFNAEYSSEYKSDFSSKYKSEFDSKYKSEFKYGATDFAIVPDDGYISPEDSPYYTLEPAHSPASSVISVADSAFDELAEVIPELSDSEHSSGNDLKEYQDMAVMSPFGSPRREELPCEMTDNVSRNSPTMFHAASPCPSEQSYTSVTSPGATALVKAVNKVSSPMKRTASQWMSTAATDLSETSTISAPAKRRKVSEPEMMARYTELLLSLQNQQQKGFSGTSFFYQDPNDSGIGMTSSAPSPGYASDKNKSNSQKSSTSQSQLFSLSDNALVKGFSVLAEYIDSDSESKSEYLDPEPDVFVKQESVEAVEVTKSYTELTNMKSMPSTGNATPPAYSDLCSTPSQNNICFTGMDSNQTFSEQVPSFSEQVPSFFMSNIKSEAPKSPEPKKAPVTAINMSNAAIAAKVVNSWKPPVKTKRPNLISHTSKPRLYNFLLELLHDSSYTCIEWVNEPEGIFKFLESAEVARLWGQRKNKPNMKYENFARSLRTYIAKGILMKPRNKLVYQFTAKFH